MDMHYGEIIRGWREAANLSQGELATKTRLSQTGISGWERTPDPPLKFIMRSIKVLKPQMKLFEFFADPDDLKNYLPYYITDQDARILRVLNVDIKQDDRVLIKEIVLTSLKLAMRAAGYDLEKL